MVKRKKAKKQEAKAKKPAAKPANKKKEDTQLPMPAFLLQILAVVLAGILIVALTLYVLGKMPARGFWVLVVILAVIAFGAMPWMRKKFVEKS